MTNFLRRNTVLLKDNGFTAKRVKVRVMARVRERVGYWDLSFYIVLSLLFGGENHNPEQLNRDFYNTETISDVVLHSKWCKISVMMKRVGCVHCQIKVKAQYVLCRYCTTRKRKNRIFMTNFKTFSTVN
jgi:hypothetical protein